MTVTNPSIEELCPIYWDDLTDDEKEYGITIGVTFEPNTSYAFTFTPTPDWCVFDENEESHELGEPYVYTVTTDGDGQVFTVPIGIYDGSLSEGFDITLSDGR